MSLLFLDLHKERQKQLRMSFLDFCIIALFIMFNANVASFLGNDVFVVFIFIILLVIFFFKNKKIDKGLFWLLGAWIVINIISSFVNFKQAFSIVSFCGVTLRMLMPYFMVKIVGRTFWDKFFKFSYVLVLISSIFWLVESFFPQLIDALVPYLNFMTQREQYVNNGFYIFVYMHSGWAEDMGLFVRNSGFMWEPGGYACVLIFLLCYHFCKIDYQVDKKIIILSLVIISTFSTAGYMALFIVYIVFLVKNKALRRKYWFLLPFFLFGFIGYAAYFYNTSEFMREKIERYIEQDKDTYNWEFEGQRILRVSRWGIIKINVENALHRPWGEGVYTSEYIVKKYGPVEGPSAIAEILRQWGWLGLIVLCLALYNFCINGHKGGWFLLLSMIVVLSSNPFLFKYLIYAVVFEYIIFNKHKKLKINKQCQYLKTKYY